MSTYVAFLRGINVGGRNIIKMVDLKAYFEEMGFENVSTYIQSGNVVFNSAGSESKLISKIEKGLSKRFQYRSSVVVLSLPRYKNIVKEAPKGFGANPDKFRYDVIFLKNEVTVKEVIDAMKIKEGVDLVYGGKHAVYFSRLISKASQSRLSRITQSPLYLYITIRNWNTTQKILEIITA